MLDFEQRIAALESVLENLIRIGEVTQVDPSAGTARVRFPDRDNLESYDLPVLVRNTLTNKDQAWPDVGERALCVFLPTGVEAGFIVGSYYNQQAPAGGEQDVRRVEFGDGASVAYDREASELAIQIGATRITATPDKVELDMGATRVEATAEVLKLQGAGTLLTLDAAGGLLNKPLTVVGPVTAASFALAGGAAAITDSGLALNGAGVTVTGADVVVDGIGFKPHKHVSAAPGVDTGPAKA